MIPIILKVKSIISWVTKNYQLIAAIIIAILVAIAVLQHNKLKYNSKQIDRLTNNYDYYASKASRQEEQNRVLQLTVDEFKESKDSLVEVIRDLQNELDIKNSKPTVIEHVREVIKTDTVVVVKGCDFNVEIKPNKLTSIIINKQDSLLTHNLEILNDHTLFITKDKVYRRKYKNWFSRLLHFDFKKKYVYNYQIHNSNDVINVRDTKIIELEH